MIRDISIISDRSCLFLILSIAPTAIDSPPASTHDTIHNIESTHQHSFLFVNRKTRSWPPASIGHIRLNLSYLALVVKHTRTLLLLPPGTGREWRHFYCLSPVNSRTMLNILVAERQLGWGRDKETSELGPGSDQPRKSAKYLELGQERVM